MASVGIVTCMELPEPDPDERPLLEALRARGLDARMLAWDDHSLAPSSFDACVVRSTWNYHEDPAQFTHWLRRADRETRLLNPLKVLLWNIHKRYLAEMERAGIPIIPTRFVDRGAPADLGAIMRHEGWNDVVVKPAVSAGSRNTRRFRSDRVDDGDCFLNALVTQRDMMVQPYMCAIERGGERALVWIDGEATHCVEKSPRFADDDESVSDALEISTDERAMLDDALRLIDGDPLYARLDVIRDEDGALRVSEFELLEPSLFLIQHPPALERFVDAIERMASA
ncbi:MAG: hypothetical protein Tsb0013_21680 [Phycisphaerales bacterium]